MRPVHFKGANISIRGKEFHDQPTFTDGEICASCWKLSWRERFVVLFSGIVWLKVFSGWTQPPAVVGTEEPFKRLALDKVKPKTKQELEAIVRAVQKRQRKEAQKFQVT